MAKTTLSRALKNSYVKTIILAAILIGSFIAFWVGLKVALRTDFPLLAVASGSMRPTLNTGDLIVVEGGLDGSEIKAESYPEGDIIVFHKSGRLGDLIVHRVIDKVDKNGTWYFQTRGDNNSGPDQPTSSLPSELVVGRVVAIVPWIGNLSLFMRTSQGMLLVFLLVLIIIVAEYLPELIKSLETEKYTGD